MSTTPKNTDPAPAPSEAPGARPASPGVSYLLETIKSLEKRTSCLLEIARLAREVRDFHDLLGRLLAKALDLVGADAGAIALADKKTGEFTFVNVHYASLPPLEAEKKEKMLQLVRLKLADGILGQVFSSGEPQVVSDLSGHAAFRKDVADTVQYEVKSIMAVPLSVEGEKLGVLEFLNKVPSGTFTPMDVDLASAVASQAAFAVEAHRWRESAGVPPFQPPSPPAPKEKEKPWAEEKESLLAVARQETERRTAAEQALVESRTAAERAEEKVQHLSRDLDTAFRLQEKNRRQTEELTRALEEGRRNQARPEAHRNALMKAFSAVSSNQPTDVVLEVLLAAVTTILQSEAASLLLVDEESGQLYFAAATGQRKDPLKKVLLKEGEGIAGWVAKNGRVLNIPDVARDPRFSDQADKSAQFQTRSILAVPLFSDSQLIGVAEAVNKKGDAPAGAAFSDEDGETLIALSLYGAMAIRKAQIYWDMNQLFLSTVRALADALESKGPGGKGRAERVRRLSLALAEELAVPPAGHRDIEIASLLHDVGKVILPGSLLDKPEALTEEEAKLLSRAPVVAAEILAPAKPLKNVVPMVRHVHERWDGEGYPDKLKEDKIPLGSRIIAMASTYEAMTADRPYRRRLPEEVAVKEIQTLRGVQLDPALVDALIRLHRKGKLKDLFK